MSNLPSHLTSLQVPRRGATVAVAEDAVVDPYDVPQPQTATCCTALQRGVALDGLTQPRYAPLRTLAPVDDEEEEELQGDYSIDGAGKDGKDDDDSTAAAAATMRSDSNGSSGSSVRSNNSKKKMVRKCKSTVDELKVSQLIQGPRLRRSVGMRRDWSFENLGNAA